MDKIAYLDSEGKVVVTEKNILESIKDETILQQVVGGANAHPCGSSDNPPSPGGSKNGICNNSSRCDNTKNGTC